MRETTKIWIKTDDTQNKSVIIQQDVLRCRSMGPLQSMK